ncbi:MAG: ATP synthase F1 subunit gamma [Anaerovoracaceae bacterium]
MAESMREIRRRIRSVETTEHITNAMRLVSAAKFRRAKAHYDQTADRLSGVMKIMEQVIRESGLAAQYRTELPEGKASDLPHRTIVVLITSNRGLCGSYNAGILRRLEEHMEQRKYKGADGEKTEPPQLSVYAIGSRGLEYLRHQKIPVLGSCLDAPERITPEKIRIMGRQLLEACGQAGDTPGGEILLVSMQYVNTLRQEATVRRLFPWDSPEEKPAEPAQAVWEREYVPSLRKAAEFMLPRYLELLLYRRLAEAAVCEHAARRTAMENASENGKEMLSHLSLHYNRARQQAITDELIEIVSGAEALKKEG